MTFTLLFGLLLVFVVIAVALAWFLIAHDHGEKEPVGALWVAAGLGLLGAVGASVLEGFFVDPKNLQPLAPVHTIGLTALAVGLIEEVCKFVPLALFVYRKRYFNEHTDGVIYFAIAGLGFGLPENILYTVQFGTPAGIGRVILTPFFHAAITGMVGYFLARRKLEGRAAIGIALPLAAAVLLHGLYDFGLVSGRTAMQVMAIGITLGLSAALFVLYVRANERDQDHGLSVVGHNSFCRSCGTHNPKHTLYCTHCGKNA